MRIGYSVEGSTDRAFLRGLQEKWCPCAELVPGSFRGSTKQSLRREIPKICFELIAKSADLIIILRDADVNPWRDEVRRLLERCRSEHRHLVVFGVPERNIECWICAERAWVATRVGGSSQDFAVDDPKPVFESKLQIRGGDRKEAEIAELVQAAPLGHWWRSSRSFKDFYERLWAVSRQRGCEIENLRGVGLSSGIVPLA